VITWTKHGDWSALDGPMYRGRTEGSETVITILGRYWQRSVGDHRYRKTRTYVVWMGGKEVGTADTLAKAKKLAAKQLWIERESVL